MSQGLVIAGLAAAALYLLSPDLRRSVNGFLEQLATEERRKSQLLEAERRAAIISDAFKSFPSNRWSITFISPSWRTSEYGCESIGLSMKQMERYLNQAGKGLSLPIHRSEVR
jgi:hypothetical protein